MATSIALATTASADAPKMNILQICTQNSSSNRVMESKEIEYFVTVRVDEMRTRDYRITARNAYNARWVFLQVNPTAKVISIRPVNRVSED
jgi:hypothetical protein